MTKTKTKTKASTQSTGNLDVGAATAALKAIPDGKVVDFITGRLMNDTPEEYVRQNVEMSLVLEYNYPRDQVEVECPRRSNIDPPCRSNIDPGMGAGRMTADCG